MISKTWTCLLENFMYNIIYMFYISPVNLYIIIERYFIKKIYLNNLIQGRKYKHALE